MPSSFRRVVQFTAPCQVEVIEEPLPAPDSDQVLVRTTLSAISPGTERLIYQGDAPSEALDSSIEALSGDLEYPLTYGYAAVGRVVDSGSDVEPDWEGKRVFSFQPHASHFVASPESLLPLPDGARDVDGILIPNLETAVNLLMDGRPLIGERVVVFGQGVVGLLTTALASTFPLEALFCLDPIPQRRSRSEAWGADRTFDPVSEFDAVREALGVTAMDAKEAEEQDEGSDLTFELSGKPPVLNDAISITGYDGRVVIGSWYGERAAAIDLGGRFHRSRMQLVSSQVSSIRPEYRGRWTKNRRMDTVLRVLPELAPGDLVSHVFSQEEAPQAYRELSRDNAELLQPVFQYS